MGWPKFPIILALDKSQLSEAIDLASSLKEYVAGFKIGTELFVAAGPAAVERLKGLQRKLFLDLKLHDIPNTVARTVRIAVHLGVDMLSLHCLGGPAMLQAAVEAAIDEADRCKSQPPLLLGVTILTSLNDEDLSLLGFSSSTQSQVLRLGRLAINSGLQGLVCSPKEVGLLRQEFGPTVTLVTPGVRASAGTDDQQRVLNAAEALRRGATWLVVGRPITSAPNPVKAALSLLSEIDGAFSST